MKKTNQQTEEALRPSRRRFLTRIWALLGVGFLGELLWLVADFLRPRPARKTRDSVIVAGPVDRFENGSVTAFPAGAFYLVRLRDGGFLAVSRECTHLGCTVVWEEKNERFRCPCHASVFEITGAVLQSPAPRPLDCFEVHIENRVVKVDTSVRKRRSSFTSGQETMA